METARSQPILLIAAGPGAVATLGQLPEAARNLSVRVAGPFGLIVAQGPAGRVRTSSCFWLSEIGVPEAVHRGGVLTGEFDETLFRDLCSLVRRLQAGGQEAAGNRSRVRVQGYVIADLAAPGIVPFIINLVQLVRRADPAIELTGLALTGRTVETGTAATSAWYETFDQLAAGMEKVHLLQRLYILDGEDTNRTWLRNPEEMHRIGADFILHHGLSPYRHHLRRFEKTRTSLREGFLDFCGSVMCKRFHWDPSTVAREIAATVANDTSLQERDQGVLSEERSDALDGLAQRLAMEVSTAYQREDPAKGTAPPKTSPSSETHQDKRALASLEQVLKEVCSEMPVSSLRWFLSRFRLRLDELTTFSRLRARWDSRHRAARDLRKQVQDTYIPIKKWQEHQDVQWQTPFRPFFKDPPWAILSRPVSVESYLTGVGIAAAGLVMVALGSWFRQPMVMIGGGVVAIWASVVAVLDTRWVRHRRVVVLQGEKVSPAVPDSYFQACASNVQLAFAALFFVGALGCLGWSLWNSANGAIRAGAIVFGAVAAVCGLTGAGLVYASVPRKGWPTGVPDDRHAPGLAPPRSRPWFFTGLGFLTVAWLALYQAMNSLHMAFDMAVLSGGLASLWAALALAQFPRYGSIKLVCKDLRKPAPPTPVEAKSVEMPQLAGYVEKLRSWVDRLIAVSEPLESEGLNWNHASLEDPLPRMFSPHWQSQLAQIFRSELEAQTGRTLEQMIADPGNWARCLVEGLSDPDLELSNPLHIFCLYYVKRWLREKPLERVISQLTVDRTMLISAVSASAPPRWPQTRYDPEIDASVIAVGKELWDIIAPFTDANDPHRFVMVDWKEPYTVAVVRTVLGLSRGWRGYPGLPGQRQSTGDSAEAAPLILADGPVIDGRLRSLPVPDVRPVC